jgi:hypothetical protein
MQTPKIKRTEMLPASGLALLPVLFVIIIMIYFSLKQFSKYRISLNVMELPVFQLGNQKVFLIRHVIKFPIFVNKRSKNCTVKK